MDKKIRFKASEFIEVDDLFGGRKTVMVGADGITFWDALCSEKVTPILIHPIFKPELIGGMIEFVRNNDLVEALRNIASFINQAQDQRADRDQLYVMRVLLAYSKGLCNGSAEAIEKAVLLADEEEKRALEAQAVYEQFVAEAQQDAQRH